MVNRNLNCETVDRELLCETVDWEYSIINIRLWDGRSEVVASKVELWDGRSKLNNIQSIRSIALRREIETWQ